MKKVLILFVALIVPAAAFAMAKKTESIADKLQVTLSVEKKGDAAVLTINVKNTCGKKIACDFTSSKTFDFVIKDMAGSLVWQWSKDRLFMEALQNIPIDPEKSITHSEKWNYTDSEGAEVKPGKYHVTGTFFVMPGNINTETMVIEVLDEDLKKASGYIIN